MSATLAVVVPVALKATLLLALAAGVERALLRRSSAAARHLLWTFTLAGVLCLPALESTLPGWRLTLPSILPAAPAERPMPAPARDLAAGMSSLPPVDAGPWAEAASSPAPVATGSARPALAAERAAAPPVRWTHVLAGVYLAGVLLLLVRVAAEQLVVRRLARGATPVRDEAWTAMVRSLAERFGVRRPVVLLRSDAPTMPLTWGMARPFVLVPADADAWPAERRRAVLLHELAHVARHDCLTQTLAAIACAVYWPHPGVWWAAARLRVERELACDDQVIARGVPARDYAGHLLAIARGVHAPRPLTALAVGMAAPSHLELRLRAAIDRTRVRTAPGARASAVGAALTAVLLLPLAALRADARSVEPVVVSPPVRVDAPVAVASPAPRETTRAPVDTTPVDSASSAAPAAVDSAAPVVTPAADTVTVAAQPPAGATFGGRWWMRPASAQEAPADRPTLHVMLNAGGLNTFLVAVARLDGVSADVRAPDAPSRFRLRQEAGTFAFDGGLRAGQGSGTFEFTPDRAFADALVRRGMAAPSDAQLFSMARHGVGLDLLDELAAHGYAQPSTGELERVGLTGVDVAHIRDMAALGYRLGSVGALVRLHNAGVSPGLVRELAALGYRDLSPADLTRLANQGVRASFIRQANERAGRQLPVGELVQLRVRGEVATASPRPARPPATATPPSGTTPARSGDGSTPVSGRWVILDTRPGWVHLELRWDDDTQWRRYVAPAELRGLPAGAIGSGTATPVAFRIERDAGRLEFDGSVQGGRGSGQFRFDVDRGVVPTLRSLGIAEMDEVSDHDLKNLVWGGISTADVRAFQSLGFTSLTWDDVVSLAVFAVTPEYARAMRAAGVTDATTPKGIVDLRHLGVPSGYAGELAALGYRGLDGGQLIALRRAGVTGEFIRQLRAAGERDLSVDALIQRAQERRNTARRPR